MSNWIPIKTRHLTDEERKYYTDLGYLGHSSDEILKYDCTLPDDGQKVLVTDRFGDVETDTFYRNDVDGCYFEIYCDEGDILAWMPYPEPYKEV